MNRALVAAGVAATLAGLWIAASVPGSVVEGQEPGDLVLLLALAGLAGGAYLLYDVTHTSSSRDPVPWSEAGPIVDSRPETYPDSPPLAGRAFAETVTTAAETARHHRERQEGIAVVRDPLREAYLEAMAAAGVNRATAERNLAEGTWTDDQAAAAVLSPEVPWPERSLRRRILDWLYPGRAVRRLTRRAVDAVARASGEEVPPVVGQDAPRNVPIYRPSLADYQQEPGGEIRGPGGEVREADPLQQPAPGTGPRDSTAPGESGERTAPGESGEPPPGEEVQRT